MAIAFDSSGTRALVAPGTSITKAHTCSGSDRFLVVSIFTSTSAEVMTGITYAGVAMVQAIKRQNATSHWIYIYTLANPASGANNVVASFTSATAILHICSYTGVNQVSIPEATGSYQGGPETGNRTASVTTLTNNAWLVSAGVSITQDADAAVNGTWRNSGDSFAPYMSDSAAPLTPAGAYTIGWNYPSSDTHAIVAISLAPSTPTGLLANLISYWKLDEASGSRADSHGSNTLADNNTVGSATGKINLGADFEAANSEFLSIADASQSGLDLTGDLTFSFWYKPESQPATDTSYALIGKFLQSVNQSYFLQYRDDGGTKNLGCGMYVDGQNLTFTAVAQTLTNGTWYHIVLTKSGTTGQFYVNGSAVGASFTTVAAYNGTAPFMIGSLNGSLQFTDGIIDEVGIWNRALTSGEITSLYNAGAGLAYPFTPANTSNFFLVM